MFCALRDQLASSGRHAELMRCFSAVAELLVNKVVITDPPMHLKVVVVQPCEVLMSRNYLKYNTIFITSFNEHF